MSRSPVTTPRKAWSGLKNRWDICWKKYGDAGDSPRMFETARRRVLFRDLMTYKKQTDQQRLKALEELSALDQELGLGY